jgi:hypothetical protein
MSLSLTTPVDGSNDEYPTFYANPGVSPAPFGWSENRASLWLEAGRQAVHVGDGDGERRVALAAQR